MEKSDIGLNLFWPVYFENIMKNGALFSIIFSKVFKILLKFSDFFFQFCLKIENDVMI